MYSQFYNFSFLPILLKKVSKLIYLNYNVNITHTRTKKYFKMTLCPFAAHKDIFGAPGTGAHALRLFDIAIVDYLLTIIVAVLTTGLTKVPISITTIGWLLVSILFHMLFGVESNDMKWFGLTC